MGPTDPPLRASNRWVLLPSLSERHLEVLSMTTLRFDITLPDGSKESVETDAERVLIGRGAHCEVCLGVTELATEHVAVEIVGDTVRLVARAFVPPPTLNGQEISEAIVPRDAVLRIGELAITITQVGALNASAVQ